MEQSIDNLYIEELISQLSLTEISKNNKLCPSYSEGIRLLVDVFTLQTEKPASRRKTDHKGILPDKLRKTAISPGNGLVELSMIISKSSRH